LRDLLINFSFPVAKSIETLGQRPSKLSEASEFGWPNLIWTKIEFFPQQPIPTTFDSQQTLLSATI